MHKMKSKTLRKKRMIAVFPAVFLLVAAGVVVYLSFAKPSIAGDWLLSVNPERSDAAAENAEKAGKAYYSFGNPGKYGDGVYKTFFDGGVEEGQYKLSEKDGQTYIYLGTVELPYHLTGSALFGNAKLTITYPEQSNDQTGEKTPAQDYIFVREKAPDYEKMSYDSFETDEALLSEWSTSERTLPYYTESLSYTETVQFQKNGILTIHYESDDLALDRVLYYAYSAQNGTLTFSPVTDKDTTYTVTYAQNKDTTLQFTDNTSSSVFADAFFGDAVYRQSE